MTDYLVRLSQHSPGTPASGWVPADEVAVTGSISCRPFAPDINAARVHAEGPDRIILPEPFSVRLVNGECTLPLRPTDAWWCWELREQTKGGRIRHLTVADSALVLDYADAVDVDPVTLTPAASAVPAWTAAVEAVQGYADAAALSETAAETAQGLAEDARDAAQALTDVTVTTGAVVGDDLILTRTDATTVNAGNVRGPQGLQGPSGSIEWAGSGNYTTATTAGCQAVGTNAAQYLTTPTYDGSGVGVHPTVCQVSGGFAGYEFWMAFTPYTGGSNAVENPSILASHDGLTWVVPPGLTNPIKAKGPAGTDFNSDPYLMHHDGLLWCFYRSVEAAYAPDNDDRLYYKTSPDGVVWSAEVLVHTCDSTTSQIVSPSVVHHGGAWHMWAVDNIGTNRLLHWTSITTPTAAAWSAPTVCTVAGLVAGHEPWHTDVSRDGAEWVMTVHETPGGTSTASGYLHRAISTDGVAWTCDPRPMMTGVYGAWDGRLYRGCLRPAMVNGRHGYRLWYSALTGSSEWHIGHGTVALREVTTRAGADLPAACWPLPPYIAGDKVDRADSGTPGNLTSGQAWIVAAGGTVPVVGKALSSLSGVCSIDPGRHDVEIGATLRALPTVGFACLIGAKLAGATTDYVQFGLSGPTTYHVGVRIANVSNPATNIGPTPVVGDRLTLRIRGNTAEGFVNDLLICRVDITALAAYNEVGIRFALGSGAVGAYNDLYVTAL